MMARLLFLIATFLVISTLHASDIPPELEEWKGWVSYEKEFMDCPNLNGGQYGSKANHLCAWPGQLTISVSDTQANFNQQWHILDKGLIPLPGDRNHWPQQVTVNDSSVVVIEKAGRPYIYLTKGQYKIEGKILWDKRAESLSVPSQTGLLEVLINGKAKAFAKLEKGRLWLGNVKETKVTEKNYLKVRANRLIQDGHPMTMTVEVEVEVSGNAREQKLTRFDRDHYQLKSITSELNTRVDSAGDLWVQLRPGEHRLELVFKVHGYPQELTFSETGEHWPLQELWAFVADERLRSVQIEGVAPIDSEQGLVRQWSQHPHYVVSQTDSFKIKQKHRGMSHNFDSLSLNRQLWLSFDGESYYFQDEINGNKSTNWRINTLENYRLSQLSNHGEDRLITYDNQQRTGAEIRTPRVNVLASGEVNMADMNHASGWDMVFADTQVSLNIPPGRKLLAVTGADSASGDWVNRWKLIDLFFVLVSIALAYRAFGIVASMLGLLVLVLGYHETQMPIFLWFNVMVAVTLAKKVSGQKLKKISGVYQWISLVGLLLALLPFIADQIRFTLYPQLEKGQVLYTSNNDASLYDNFASVSALEEPTKMRERMSREQKIVITGSRMKRADLDNSYQAGAIIQAGNGKPLWQWQRASYGWNGPVAGDEKVSLLILPEFMVKLWRLLLVIGSLLWLAAIFKQRDNSKIELKNIFGKTQSGSDKAVASSLVIGLIMGGLLFTAPPQVSASSYPDEKLLSELQSRLFPVPECSPDCVTISRSNITVNGQQIVVSLDYHAGSDVAGLLPDSEDWQIETISLNRKPVNALWRNEKGRWIDLKHGHSKVVIQARLKNKSEISIQFVESPKRVEHEISGWEVSGVNQHQLMANALQLTRINIPEKVASEIALNGNNDAGSMVNEHSIAGLFEIERYFHFGTQWELRTNVYRQAPEKGSLSISIPLLSYEQPLDMVDNIKQRKMEVAFATDDDSKSWRSSLAGDGEFELQALEQNALTEIWKLLVFPNWNIEINGVVAVRPEFIENDDFWIYEYYPRTGEKLAFKVTRPSAAEGTPVAITNVTQQYKFGKRKVSNDISIDYKATRSEQFLMHIGESELKQLTHDGTSINLGDVDGVLSIPLKPGEHSLQLTLESEQMLSFQSSLSSPDIVQAFSNSTIGVQVPSSRWLLAASGPGYGPAVIYWGELIFFLLLATGLSRLSFSPLNYWQWLVLGLGMSTFSWPAMAWVTIWLLGCQWRRQNNQENKQYSMQSSWLILLSTIAAVITLVMAVPFGLLQSPDMGVVGNGSYGNSLQWFLDRGEGTLGEIIIYSLPVWVYKGLMLLWATWLSFSLIRWLGWVWSDLSKARFIKRKAIIKAE